MIDDRMIVIIIINVMIIIIISNNNNSGKLLRSKLLDGVSPSFRSRGKEGGEKWLLARCKMYLTS